MLQTAHAPKASTFPQSTITAAIAAALLLTTAGCANYRITQELTAPIPVASNCRVGSILDQLPPDAEPEDRPTEDELSNLRQRLDVELRKIDELQIVGPFSDSIAYEVTGGILSFRRGSGAVRFFIGFGLGNAEVVVELHLVDLSTGESVFSGNFKGTVSHWAETGDQVFQQIAKEFVKALRNEVRRAAKAGADG
jgi:hypothetical protein